MAEAAVDHNLLFITYTDAQDGRTHDSDTRRLVRKRALDASRTKDATGKIKIRQPPASRASVPLKQSLGRFRLRKEPAPKPKESNAEDDIPPVVSVFEPMIGSLGDDSWTLLRYYHHRFRQNSIAVNVDGDWLAFTWSDPAASHAQLALIARTMDWDVNQPESSLAIRHTSTAVQLIQQKLQTGLSHPDNSLIGAVSLLCIVESMQDHKRSAAAHFKGLNEMVALRGGYDAFGSAKSLRRVVAWAQRCYYLRWEDGLLPPPFLNETTDDTDGSPLSPEDSISSAESSDNFHRYQDIISPSLVDLLDDFKHIGSFPRRADRTRLDRLKVAQAIYDVEYKLVLLHQDRSGQTFESPEPSRDLSIAFQLAAQIYSFIVLRQVPQKSSIVQKFATQLLFEIARHGLYLGELGDLDSATVYSWHALSLWIVVLLMIAAPEKVQSFPEFNELLETLIDIFEIADFRPLLEILKEIAWMDDILQPELLTLWNEVRLPQKLSTSLSWARTTKY